MMMSAASAAKMIDDSGLTRQRRQLNDDVDDNVAVVQARQTAAEYSSAMNDLPALCTTSMQIDRRVVASACSPGRRGRTTCALPLTDAFKLLLLRI